MLRTSLPYGIGLKCGLAGVLPSEQEQLLAPQGYLLAPDNQGFLKLWKFLGSEHNTLAIQGLIQDHLLNSPMCWASEQYTSILESLWTFQHHLAINKTSKKKFKQTKTKITFDPKKIPKQKHLPSASWSLCLWLWFKISVLFKSSLLKLEKY